MANGGDFIDEGQTSSTILFLFTPTTDLQDCVNINILSDNVAENNEVFQLSPTLNSQYSSLQSATSFNTDQISVTINDGDCECYATNQYYTFFTYSCKCRFP